MRRTLFILKHLYVDDAAFCYVFFRPEMIPCPRHVFFCLRLKKVDVLSCVVGTSRSGAGVGIGSARRTNVVPPSSFPSWEGSLYGGFP